MLFKEPDSMQAPKFLAIVMSFVLAISLSFPLSAIADTTKQDSSYSSQAIEALNEGSAYALVASNKPPKAAIKKVSGGTNSITVKWGRAASGKISGYQLKYSIKSSVRTGHTVNVGKYSSSRKISNLKAGTRFYVKIRTYKVVDGSKVYSDWSKVKSAVTKKAPVKKASKKRYSSGGTVYITNTGEKFHRSGCSSLRRSCIPISRSSAISQGYGPCGRCHP